MQSATTSELTQSLPDLLQRVNDTPVYIREGNRDLAVLVSVADFEVIRLQKVREFERARDQLAAEVAASLAKEGITPEEFLADLFADD